MDYDHHFGNNYYKYYKDKGIKSTIYNIMAPTFVFLASDDSSYMTGQVIHNNGEQVMC